MACYSQDCLDSKALINCFCLLPHMLCWFPNDSLDRHKFEIPLMGFKSVSSSCVTLIKGWVVLCSVIVCC